MADERDVPLVHPVDLQNQLAPGRPVYYLPPPLSPFRSFGNWLVRTVLVLSILANLFFFLVMYPAAGLPQLPERLYAGQATAADKVAIVRIDGLIMEGFLSFPTQQIKQAAEDENVKAVVVAINSPGGSVTASDQLYKQIKDLREGKWEKQNGRKKPLIVAMESVAASGGYYIAAPADSIFAQPTTVTGSIGVYAMFPDLTRVPEKWGVDVRIIKKGELKGASMFRPMDPAEARQWDDLLESSYRRFMAVVQEGRKGRLKIPLRKSIEDPQGKTLANGEAYVRRLADGGVYTADQAREYGLVDEIGYLDDAIAQAKKLAALDKAKVIAYSRPTTLVESMLGLETQMPPQIEMDHLPGTIARLWYLSPGHELAGLRWPAT